MHPEIAKTLVKQRRQELTRHTAESRQETMDSAGPSWLSRLPRWRISWSRARLSPAGGPAGGPAVAGPDPSGKRGSSLVIIISAYRSA
jgi:hypothetical protein